MPLDVFGVRNIQLLHIMQGMRVKKASLNDTHRDDHKLQDPFDSWIKLLVLYKKKKRFSSPYVSEVGIKPGIFQYWLSTLYVHQSCPLNILRPTPIKMEFLTYFCGIVLMRTYFKKMMLKTEFLRVSLS